MTQITQFTSNNPHKNKNKPINPKVKKSQGPFEPLTVQRPGLSDWDVTHGQYGKMKPSQSPFFRNTVVAS